MKNTFYTLEVTAKGNSLGSVWYTLCDHVYESESERDELAAEYEVDLKKEIEEEKIINYEVKKGVIKLPTYSKEIDEACSDMDVIRAYADLVGKVEYLPNLQRWCRTFLENEFHYGDVLSDNSGVCDDFADYKTFEARVDCLKVNILDFIAYVKNKYAK